VSLKVDCFKQKTSPDDYNKNALSNVAGHFLQAGLTANEQFLLDRCVKYNHSSQIINKLVGLKFPTNVAGDD